MDNDKDPTGVVSLLSRVARGLELEVENVELRKDIERVRSEATALSGELEDMRRVLARSNPRLDLRRPAWSWLRSAESERVLYEALSDACNDVMEHYDSQEVGITGALAGLLCSKGRQVSGRFEQEVAAFHPNVPVKLEVSYVDCQKNIDVGGADFAMSLEVDIVGLHRRCSFSAFQAKKWCGRSLSFSARELQQLQTILLFTHASYYIVYPCTEESKPPLIVPARTLDAYARATNSHSISREAIEAVALGLPEYFMYDFMPGWSGDERRNDQVCEFVEHALRPIHILKVRITVGDR